MFHGRLKNKWRALFELRETFDSKPNIQEEFSIFRYTQIIEQEMKESDMRSAESSGIDVSQLVVFQNKFVNLNTTIEKAVIFHLDFWRELLEDNPDIKKLQHLGSKITNIIVETDEQYHALTKINPNHIKLLEIYGYFLKDVIYNESEGLRLIEKSEQLKNSPNTIRQLEDKRVKYGENSNCCIITASGNQKDMGIITDCNNEIKRLLGYSKSEVIGQSVDKLMPKIFANFHHKFMQNYFEKNKGNAMGMERDVFAMSKHGYIIPCTLLIKVMPSLGNGIQILSFLIEKEPIDQNKENANKNHYIIYGENTGIVYGVSKSCFDSFNIKSKTCYGQCPNMSELTLERICPGVLDPVNDEDYRSNSGILVTLDTTQILDINFDDSDVDDLEEEKQMLIKEGVFQETDR